jgi:prepilin-type N-terminal cleavage/methylation domain-containing protein
MRFATNTTSERPVVDAPRAGFTLIEVLAAMVFMAIVIPVAVNGVRVANRAGVVAQRKDLAARIAKRLLNEAVLARQWSSTTGEVGTAPVQTGVDNEGQFAFHWTVRDEPWNQSGINDLGLRPVTANQTSFNQSGGASPGSGPAGTSPVSITDVNVFRQISAEVTYPVQNQTFTVRLTTLLVDLAQ